MLKKSVIFSMTLISNYALALVPPNYQEPPGNLSAEIEAGFQLNTGNTESTSFNGRTKLIYDTKKATQEGTIKAYFASNSEKTLSEKYDLQLQSNYKFDNDYLFGRGDFSWDQFGSFTRVFTFSSGYGFDAIHNDVTKLRLEIGPGYRYNLPANNDDIDHPIEHKEFIIRTAAKYEQKIHEYTSLSADLTTESGESNNIITLEMAYKNTIFQNWAFKIGFNIKYTEIVPENTKQTDTTTMFNLLYTFQT